MTPVVTAIVNRSSANLQNVYVVLCLEPWSPVPSVQLHQQRAGHFVYSGAFKHVSNQVMLWLEANIDHSPGKMCGESLILQSAYLTKYT